MNSQIDWSVLYTQGRCKNYGVPWTEGEAHAASVLKIPADFVRRGCLTLESYEKMLSEDSAEIEKTGKIPLTQCKKEHLLELCAKYSLSVTDEATRAVLIEELKLAGCPNQVDIKGDI